MFFTTAIEETIMEADIIFISVNTPTKVRESWCRGAVGGCSLGLTVIQHNAPCSPDRGHRRGPRGEREELRAVRAQDR